MGVGIHEPHGRGITEQQIAPFLPIDIPTNAHWIADGSDNQVVPGAVALNARAEDRDAGIAGCHHGVVQEHVGRALHSVVLLVIRVDAILREADDDVVGDRGVSGAEVTTQGDRNIVVSIPEIPTQEVRDAVRSAATALQKLISIIRSPRWSPTSWNLWVTPWTCSRNSISA